MLLESCRRAAGSAWSSLRRPKTQTSYLLPTELWEVILDYALAIPFLLDTDCSPIDFYFFANAHRAGNAASVDRKSYERRRRTLGAVCRLWRAIVAGRKKIWVHCVSTSPVWNLGPETRRIDIFLDTFSGATSPLAAAEVGAPRFRNIQVMALYGSSRSTSIFHNLGSNGVGLNEVLNAVQRSGSSIHSFIYEGDLSLGPTHLQNITKTFPRLTTLTLHAMEIRGSLSIPALRALSICAQHLDTSQWELPSLRHLALGDKNRRLFGVRYKSLNLGAIKSKLLSLMIIPPYWDRLDHSFWADHPSLQFLGVPDLYSEIGEPTHNARILCITDSGINGYDDAHLGLYYHLSQFPLLKTLITPNRHFHHPPWPTAVGYAALLKYCADNDISWYIEHDQKAKKPLEPGNSRRLVKRLR
ncbi:hypothetical protein FRC17_010114 [Serendipita sp. 399]|nr:hypothetical protein FRC17_010114 [Serendipita sp. 399]